MQDKELETLKSIISFITKSSTCYASGKANLSSASLSLNVGRVAVLENRRL
jgi:hypothetical protein